MYGCVCDEQSNECCWLSIILVHVSDYLPVGFLGSHSRDPRGAEPSRKRKVYIELDTFES